MILLKLKNMQMVLLPTVCMPMLESFFFAASAAFSCGVFGSTVHFVQCLNGNQFLAPGSFSLLDLRHC